MAFPTIDERSTELAASNSANQNYAPNTPAEVGGKVRRVNFTLDTTSMAADYVYLLGIIPAGAKLAPGHLWHPDVGTTCTVAFGLSATDGGGYIDADGDTVADAEAYLTAAAVDLAGSAGSNVGFNHLQADSGFQYTIGRECYLTMTGVTAATVGAHTVEGYIEYVLD